MQNPARLASVGTDEFFEAYRHIFGGDLNPPTHAILIQHEVHPYVAKAASVVGPMMTLGIGIAIQMTM